MNTRTRPTLALLLAGSLAFVGCEDSEKPKYEDYYREIAIIRIIGEGELMLEDIDGDGKVDFIGYAQSNNLKYVQPGYEGRAFPQWSFLSGTEKMPSGVRNAASQVLKANQDLWYQMDKNSSYNLPNSPTHNSLKIPSGK